jgi:hypothetical protein
MHNNILMEFNYKVSSNMFLPLMWPTSWGYKEEYNYNYKSVIKTIPPLKIIT